MKPVRQSYEQRAEQFAKVCDIAIQMLSDANIPLEEKTRMIRTSMSDKELALHPEPMYKRIGSLKCIEAEHFWYWNEHQGVHIDKFWQEVKAAGLGYHRKDIFVKILMRGRIGNRIEYDYVIDEILVAEQTERITKEEVARLNNYLLNYEKLKSKNDSL